jgi:hypothetical protein
LLSVPEDALWICICVLAAASPTGKAILQSSAFGAYWINTLSLAVYLSHTTTFDAMYGIVNQSIISLINSIISSDISAVDIKLHSSVTALYLYNSHVDSTTANIQANGLA